MSNQAWAVKAKMSGEYPLCRVCREPIHKSDWKAFEKRGRICKACDRGIDLTLWKNQVDQVLSHADRGSIVITFER